MHSPQNMGGHGEKLVRDGSLCPTPRPQGWDSGHQVVSQVPLPAELLQWITKPCLKTVVLSTPV